MGRKTFILIVPLIAMACGFSRSAFVVLPTEQLPSPSPPVEATKTQSRTPPTQEPTHECTVTAKSLHLRASPGLDGIVIAWLNAGDILTIQPDQPSGNWIRVQTDDQTGWINSNYCKEIP